MSVKVANFLDQGCKIQKYFFLNVRWVTKFLKYSMFKNCPQNRLKLNFHFACIQNSYCSGETGSNSKTFKFTFFLFNFGLMMAAF